MRQLYNEKTHELYDIKADALDAEGLPRFNNGAYGGVGGHNFEHAREAEVQVRYKDRIFFCDLYRYSDELRIHMHCPRCTNVIRISSTRKALEWDPVDGILSVEPMECPWEIGRGTDGTTSDRIAFGLGLCRFKFAIDANIMKDA